MFGNKLSQKGLKGKLLRRRKHNFLLTLFPPGEHYAELPMNGFWLVKYFSNNTHEWEVAIHDAQSFVIYKKLGQKVPVRKLTDSEQTTIL
jgi:hypothetical protein